MKARMLPRCTPGSGFRRRGGPGGGRAAGPGEGAGAPPCRFSAGEHAGEQPFPAVVDDYNLADGHFAERGGLRGERYAAEPVQAGGAGCLAGAVGAGGVVVEGDGGHV